MTPFRLCVKRGPGPSKRERRRPTFAANDLCLSLEERLAPPYVEPPPHEFRDATYDERLEGAIYGLLIGDALGVPYEFHAPEKLPPREAIDFNPPAGFARAHGQVPPGTWSDDGAQALALLASLLHCNRFDEQDYAHWLIAWRNEGYMAVDGRVFDCGIQTGTAIRRLACGVAPHAAGPSGENENGNGSLMRVLPLALWHQGSDAELVEDGHRQSLLTHGHPRSQVCCALYCLWARGLLLEDHDAWNAAVRRLQQLYENRPEYASELALVLGANYLKRPTGSGYVVDALWSTRHALREPVFDAVVRSAIALGHDTDTTACIVGGLAGIRDGMHGIPAAWRRHLRGKPLVRPLVAQLKQRMQHMKRPPRRLLDMVGVLYARGYQRIRYYPHIGGPGAYRFILTVDKHYTFRTARNAPDTRTLWESMGNGHRALDWASSLFASADRLADDFIGAYPRLAREGKGADPEYYAWFLEMVAAAGSDGVPVFRFDGSGLPEGRIAILSERARAMYFTAPPGFAGRLGGSP